MKKGEEEKGERAWFLEREIDKMKRQHEDEVKSEHQEWKKKEHEVEDLERKKTRGYSKKIMKHEGGVEHRHHKDKMVGGVRGKPHPETKMDRKGRTDKTP